MRFSRYFTGPAKSTPITLKGILPSVLSLYRGAGGGFAKATAWKRLQPLHFLMTLFVNFRRGSIQNFSLTQTMVRLTPPWSVVTWARCTIFPASRAESGKYIGYLPWIRPRHSNSPSSLGAACSVVHGLGQTGRGSSPAAVFSWLGTLDISPTQL